MGLYSHHCFPRLLNWAMSGKGFTRIRSQLLKPVSGRVLEVGVGSGLNLPHYSGRVKSLTLLDRNPAMRPLVEAQVERQRLQGVFLTASLEAIPLESQQFDAVVCTWVLCSVTDPQRALQEMARVLKPGGQLYYVEHGLSPEPRVQKWQARLNPLQACIGDGCQLNRDIRQLLAASPFQPKEHHYYYAPGAPKVAGYFYQGVATVQPTPPEAEVNTDVS